MEVKENVQQHMKEWNNWMSRTLHYIIRQVKRDKLLLLMLVPCFVYYIIFAYGPMYGLQIAFKDYQMNKGIWGSPLAPMGGFYWFYEFFSSVYFLRIIKNTVILSASLLIFGFPFPIMFALLLNEARDGLFKRTVQTISYMPYFISIVVTCGLVLNFLSPQTGVINSIIEIMGGKAINFMVDPAWYRPIYVISDIWQGFGWNSILYLAAISNIDPQLYEAAKMDGAKRIQQMIYVTLPCILPTAVILFILNSGNIMNIGFEKVNLLYNPSIYSTSDIISTYVYRKGIISAEYSYSSAVGLFNSAVNVTLLIIVNKFSKRLANITLW